MGDVQCNAGLTVVRVDADRQLLLVHWRGAWC